MPLKKKSIRALTTWIETVTWRTSLEMLKKKKKKHWASGDPWVLEYTTGFKWDDRSQHKNRSSFVGMFFFSSKKWLYMLSLVEKLESESDTKYKLKVIDFLTTEVIRTSPKYHILMTLLCCLTVLSGDYNV